MFPKLLIFRGFPRVKWRSIYEHFGTEKNGYERKKWPRSGQVENREIGKTDVRYWQAKLFRAQYKVDGERRETSEWCARIQHLGRRELFSLETPNQAAAAARARDIYLSLQSAGWEVTLEKFKPKAVAPAPKPVLTVGEFLAEVREKVSGKAKTIEDYCRAFRTIVAQIRGLDGGKEKFDHRNGGREKWIAKIESVKLADITPDEVQKWKRAFIRRAGNDPVKQRSARVSVNSLMRQAKSLFAADVLNPTVGDEVFGEI